MHTSRTEIPRVEMKETCGWTWFKSSLKSFVLNGKILPCFLNLLEKSPTPQCHLLEILGEIKHRCALSWLMQGR